MSLTADGRYGYKPHFAVGSHLFAWLYGHKSRMCCLRCQPEPTNNDTDKGGAGHNIALCVVHQLLF